MIKKMYSIQDMKAEVFFPPMLVENDFTAQRAVADAIASGQSGQLCTHTEDFRLFYVGEMEVESGLISGLPAPVLVCECSTLKKGTENDG